MSPRDTYILDLIFRCRLKDPITKCWNFTCWKNPDGYGQVIYENKIYSIHRFIAYLCLNIPLDSELHVLHKCDNPSCFNPLHLWGGSHWENHMDYVRKGKHHNASKTHCPSGDPYSEENIYWHRFRRKCKICRAEWIEEHREERNKIRNQQYYAHKNRFIK